MGPDLGPDLGPQFGWAFLFTESYPEDPRFAKFVRNGQVGDGFGQGVYIRPQFRTPIGKTTLMTNRGKEPGNLRDLGFLTTFAV
jgi:hypothetical protein